MSIFVDEEFKNLIPPLSTEEYTQLEQNCVKDGIRDPLVVWDQGDGNSILIDGHNRWDISAAHGGILFKTVSMKFDSRENAKLWIIKNQLGRRNIPPYVRAELALKLKPEIEKKAEERKNLGLKSDEGQRTDVALGEIAGLGKNTIRQVEKIQEKAPEEMKQALRRGDMSINAAHSMIVASENEDRRKREARELREAKKRADDFEEKKSEGVVDFSEIKQHKADNSLIFGEFVDDVRKMHMIVASVSGSAERDTTMTAIKAADTKKLDGINKDLMDCYRWILKIQKKIVEVIDEK